MRKGIFVLVMVFTVSLIVGMGTRAESSQLPKVGVVTTGGTIAMKYDPAKKGFVPAVSGEDLIAMAPKLRELARIELVDIARIPSSYMDPPMWIKVLKSVEKLLSDPEVAGAVITHGTDTLEETAWFLDLTVKSPKPVICIGAMRGASEVDFDGPRNLENAVRIALYKEAIGKGTMLVLNNQINAAREVTKTHTAQVETFKSGEFGFLGYVNADGKIIFSRHSNRRQNFDPSEKLPRVDIVSFFTGADGRYIKYASDDGAEGIVIVGTGLGHVNPPVHDAIEAALKAGVAVVMSTRVQPGAGPTCLLLQGGRCSIKR